MGSEVLLLGDVVQLNSGGPPMTIVDFEGDEESEAVCTFFDEKSNVIRDVFPFAALKKYERPGIGTVRLNR